jgi:coproporphyrinogen III oxidase-like Fe-S oxidoreductase
VPDEDTAAALYEVTQEVLDDAGMPAYEISNHAVPGESCRHNLTYWRYGDYAGIGPGAHGRLTKDGAKVATRQHRAPEAWLDGVESAGHATRERKALDTETRRLEMTMMGLRLTDGLRRRDLEAETGCDIEQAFAPDALAGLVDGGFLEVDEAGLRATRAGRQRLDAVLGRLLSSS